MNFNIFTFDFSYLFILLLLSFSFILLSSVTAQVIIKEKVEIKPTNTTLKKGNPNSITATSYNIRFEMDWDKPNRKAYLGLIYPESYGTGTGWQTGGSLSIELNADRSGLSFLFQIKVNLAEYEKSNVTYRIYFNGELVRSYTSVFTGHLSSIPYKNVYFFAPIANDFKFFLTNNNGNCNNNFGTLYISPIYDTTGNYWRTDKPMTFTITRGGGFIQFADYATNTVLGNTLETEYPHLQTYYLYVNNSSIPVANNKITITATANNGITREINSGILSYIEGEVSKQNNIVKNEKVNITAWQSNSYCNGIVDIPEGTTFTAKIIQGAEYGELINPQNGSTGNYLSGIIAENDKINIKFYANGNEAVTNEKIIVRISNSKENIDPLDLTFNVTPAEVVVKFDPKELTPGDTAKIIIQHRNYDGTLEPFPSDQDYEVQLIEGNNYGTILSSNGVDTSDYFGSVTDGIKFIADKKIDTSNVEVRLKVSTIYFPQKSAEKGGTAFNNLPKKSNKVKIENADVQNLVLKKSKTKGKSGNSINGTIFIITPIYGIGEAVIKETADSLDHFEITIIPDTLSIKDTLAFTETATLKIQAKDSSNSNIELDSTKLLKFSILSNERYGTFIKPNGDTLKTEPVVLQNITYADAKKGKIKFAAVKANPVSFVNCKIRVTLQGDTAKNGTREAIVLEETLKIVMTGDHEVQPIITSRRNDPEHTTYLNQIGLANRKPFSVILTRGGKPIKNHSIKLWTNYVDDSGGHDHITPRRPNTACTYPRSGVLRNIPMERARRQNYGSFYSYSSGPTFNSDLLYGMIYERSITDTVSRFEYVSSIWGSEIKIYLKSLENRLLGKDSVSIVEIIPNLVELVEGENYDLIGGTNAHNGAHNHNGTANVIRDIVRIANDWHVEYPNELVLRINDISLPNGGKFDVDGSWRGAHQTHREGKDIDIRTELYYYNRTGQIIHRDGGVPVRTPRTEPFNLTNGQLNPNSILTRNQPFEDICEDYNGMAEIHNTNTTNEHYHIDFNN